MLTVGNRYRRDAGRPRQDRPILRGHEATVPSGGLRVHNRQREVSLGRHHVT
jgi:hypothetical protein